MQNNRPTIYFLCILGASLIYVVGTLYYRSFIAKNFEIADIEAATESAKIILEQ